MINYAKAGLPVIDPDTRLMFSPNDVDIIDLATGAPLAGSDGRLLPVIEADVKTGVLKHFLFDDQGHLKFNLETGEDFLVETTTHSFEIRARDGAESSDAPEGMSDRWV